MFNNIYFEYPFFLVFPLLYIFCLYKCKEKIITIKFVNANIIKKYNKKTIDLLKLISFLIILVSSLILSSPYKKNIIKSSNTKGYEISLILDVSGSMSENNKFKIVKNIVKKFIEKRKNDKIGLTIFADFAYVAVPLTYDKNSIKSIIDKIDVGIAGTRKTSLYEALFLSSKLFENSKAKNKIAILLTDGIDNTNKIPLDVAIKTAKEYKIKVYTIGIGNLNSNYVDWNVLNKISKETNGEMFAATTIKDIENIYKKINKLEKSNIKTNKYIEKKYVIKNLFLILIILYAILYIIIAIREQKENKDV